MLEYENKDMLEAEKEEVECCEQHHVHEGIVHQVENGMPSEEMMQSLADFYKIFGDMTRVKILCVLSQSELCVCDLAEVTGMTQSAISHQLRVLKQSQLVKNRRDGKTVFYSLADDHIKSILNQGLEHISE